MAVDLNETRRAAMSAASTAMCITNQSHLMNPPVIAAINAANTSIALPPMTAAMVAWSAPATIPIASAANGIVTAQSR